MKSIRFCLSLLLLACALVALGGCSEKGKTLYYLNFKPEVASVYEEIAAKYKEETGVNLRVVTAASGTYEQTLKSEIGKKEAPALFQINGPAGYATWKNYCAELSGTEIYKHLTDKSLCITDGAEVYGIPYVVEGYGIIYNTAITDKYFALANRGTKFTSISEVDTFLELKALVEDMTAHKAELGIEGVFASTSLKAGEDWRWHTHLANVPIYYEFADKEIALGTPSAYRKVDLTYGSNFKNIFDLYINNSTVSPKLLGSKQVSDSMAEFALGKCAMVQNGNWAYSQISQIKGNTVKAENIRFLPIYTGVSGEEEQGLCIGTENYLAINKKASQEEQKMAADFLLWLYTSETGKAFVTEKLGFVAPFDTFKDEKPKDPLSREMIQYMNREDTFTVPWVFQAFPSATFKNDVGAALLQYAQGSIPWSRVEEIFRTKWESESKNSGVSDMAPTPDAGTTAPEGSNESKNPGTDSSTENTGEDTSLRFRSVPDMFS